MNLLQAAGSRDSKESRFAAIHSNRFFWGLHTNRNPLRSPAGMIYDSYYKLGGSDALIAGSNVEISNRLTICRRPGNTAGLSTFISSATVPDVIDSFYSFHEIGGNVRVFADTPTAPYLVGGAVSGSGTGSQGVIPIFTKGAGVTQSFFQGVGQSLYFSDTAEQQKWLDFGAGNPGNSFAAITAVALTSNVATITAINNFAVGQTVVISKTTAASGTFNVTATITAANAAQFQFNLTHADVVSVADTGFANGCWNLGIKAPSTSPTITITASGSAATVWQANTVFSTMGLVYDSGTTSVQQLISVNALGGNTTQFGTSGNGDPAWNQTPGGTTTDSGITWTNWGPIPAWAASKLYNNAAIGGTLANPSQIYDPTSKVMAFNAAPGNSTGTSGTTKPTFIAQQGANIHDPANQDSPPAVKWYSMFPAPSRWKASTSYPAFLGNDTAGTCVVEPFPLPAPNNQTVYLQISGGGTSGTGYTPAFSATATTQITDNQLTWQSLGSGTWAAATVYSPFTSFPNVFSAIKDSNGNLQVCISVTGNAKSGSTQPLQAWVAGKVYVNGNTISDSNGRLQTVTTGGTSGNSKTLTTSALTGGVATYTTSAAHGYATGQYITVTGSTHDPAFNISNKLITSIPSGTTFTVNVPHDNIVSAADTGNAKAGPTWASSSTTTDGTVTWTATSGAPGLQAGWGVNYADTTRDGNVVWTCVGIPLTWASGTIYHLPTTGFAPPSGSQPFGGSEVISGTSPTQNVQAVIVSGKSGAGSSPTFSTASGNFTNDNTITWQDVASFNQTQNSLVFSKGYSWAYAYKSRTVTDQYSPVAGGGLGLTPPGFFAGSPNGSLAFGPPTGSADGSVSTASPTITTTGSNTGAIVTVAGIGSTDPQVDTIVIFRTADGGGIASTTMFELTEIPNPSPIQGVAQPWTFLDFLPDNATANFPGLNTLVQAPLNHFNDPPLSGAINLVQHFQRMFYSVGATVYASDGPLVGGSSQPPGNGYTAFNPGQFWTFPSPVVRMVPTTSGLLVFTNSDVGIIVGGPAISTLFAYLRIPGLGLTSYNALAIKTGILYLLTADNQCVSLDPNLGISEIGFPIGDQINSISPSNAYAAFLIQGSNDKGFFLADGSTGWFRCNPNQSPDSAISGPVWSPKATIVGGVKAIAALEVSPGKQALLLGSASANQPILVRDSGYTTFTDNGSTYSANYTFGSIVLANPGQLAEVGFITCEFQKTGASPKLSVLLDEIADTVISISAASQSAGNTTYTYTLTSGPNVAASMFFTITGMADSGNNGTFQVASTGVNTFTVPNANGVTRAAQTGSGTRFEDLSGYISSTTGLPPQDSPYIWGLTGNPNSIFANRYYLLQSINGIVPPMGAFCRHMQIKISYGSDSVQNELLSQTIWGSHISEQ